MLIKAARRTCLALAFFLAGTTAAWSQSSYDVVVARFTNHNGEPSTLFLRRNGDAVLVFEGGFQAARVGGRYYYRMDDAVYNGDTVRRLAQQGVDRLQGRIIGNIAPSVIRPSTTPASGPPITNQINGVSVLDYYMVSTPNVQGTYGFTRDALIGRIGAAFIDLYTIQFAFSGNQAFAFEVDRAPGRSARFTCVETERGCAVTTRYGALVAVIPADFENRGEYNELFARPRAIRPDREIEALMQRMGD